MTTTDHRTIGPSPDDWALYGAQRRIYTRNKARPANDNRPDTLLTYRNTPDHPYEPLQSNWSTTPSGVLEYDANGESRQNVARLPQELALEVTPSIEEILLAMRGDWEWKQDPEHSDDELVAKIGYLAFSNGQHRERAYKVKDGEVGVYLCRMPRGAMLCCTEKTGAARGGGQNDAAGSIGNANLTAMLLGPDAMPRPYITGGRIIGGVSMKHAERRAALAQAIANTPKMPPVTSCPPGIANGTARASDNFLGMKVAATGKSGSIGWVDFYVAGRERAAWLAAVDDLDEQTSTVLEAALTADSYADVGIVAGQSVEYARRRGGKRAIAAANDNLAASVEKFAS